VEQDALLSEATEAAQAALEYEPEEDEEITVGLIKQLLKANIADRRNATPKTAAMEEEVRTLTAAQSAIVAVEAKTKALKESLKQKTLELRDKLEVKKFGVGEAVASYTRTLSELAEALAEVKADATKSAAERDKQRKAIENSIMYYEQRIAAVQFLEAQVGQITADESRILILRKHHDLIADQLERYLNAELRALVSGFVTLHDKYAVSAQDIEADAHEVENLLQSYFRDLRYWL
jgi:type I restriction enzyme M protein